MKPVTPIFWLGLLAVVCLSLGVTLQPRAATWSRGAQAESVFKLVLGDGRRLFANHFFVRADMTFHGGYYPSIFDAAEKRDTTAMASAQTDHDEDEHYRAMALGTARDWIEAFGRNFRVTEHKHLGDGREREILPWLRISAELDPQRVETYTVASYWLCKQLGKVEEAEQFLREGLRSNPNSPEILYELGRLYAEDRADAERARNVLDLALTHWRRQEATRPEPNMFLLGQITLRLANLEAAAGNHARAISLLELTKQASPNPGAVQELIEDIRRQAAAK